jgi:hypothetical protein
MRADDRIIPAWVPPAVKRMARGLTPDRPDIKWRLMIDPRMKAVWTYLRRAKVKQEAISRLEPWRRLPPDERGSPSDEACAAFFVAAATEPTHDRQLRTRAEIEATEPDPRADEAACKDFHWISPAPWRTALEVVRLIRERESRTKIDFEAVSIVESYLEHGLHQRECRDPYVLERSSGSRNDDLLRSKVRRLAIETQKIFGTCHYGIIATVVEVALDLDISEHTARNWCAGLTTPANKQRS